MIVTNKRITQQISTCTFSISFSTKIYSIWKLFTVMLPTIVLAELFSVGKNTRVWLNCLSSLHSPVLPGILFGWMRTSAAVKKGHHRAGFFLLACLRSWTQVNFSGMPAIKTEITNTTGHFCFHIGTASQEVPAAMSQVGWQHMRTRLYQF